MGQSTNVLAISIALMGVAVTPGATMASHAWDGYHWARTADPARIVVIDSMTADWDDNLGMAIADWHGSSVLELTPSFEDDREVTRMLCPAVPGRVRACNGSYGPTGWLGIAQVWVTGDHIIQGVALMNDTYLSAQWVRDTTNRQQVICQELGHLWGLDHQDESGADLGTCMDYARAQDNPHPNHHDYEQLEQIYRHLDDFDSTASLRSPGIRPRPGRAGSGGRALDRLGRLVDTSPDGAAKVFMRRLPGGIRLITHVLLTR